MSIDDALNDLDDALLAIDAPDYDAPVEPPADVNIATARLARLGRLRREFVEIEAAAETRKTQIDDYVDAQRNRIARETGWLEESLRRYHEAVLRLDPTRMTLHLPTGDLISRMGQATWTVTDETALISWLAKHAPDAVRRRPPIVVPPDVDRAEMKKLLVRRDESGKRVLAYGIDPETGERPPGLVVEEPVRKFTPTPLDPIGSAEPEEDA